MTKIDRPNRDALSNALDIYRDAMRPFIVRCLKRVQGMRVEDAISEALKGNSRNQFLRNLHRSGNVEYAIDINDFPHLVTWYWYPVFHQAFNYERTVKNLLYMIKEVRNEVVHPEEDLDAEYARSRLYDIADVLGRINASDEKRAVEDIRDQLLEPVQSEDGGSDEVLERPGQNNNDGVKNVDVTSFVKRVRDLAIDGLPDEIKPTKNSRKAVKGRENKNDRCYHLWYSDRPWGNWGSLCYEVGMRFDDPSKTASCSNALVAIRYGENKYGQIGGLSDGKSKSLKSFVNNLDIHEDQRLRQRNSWGRVEVNFGSNTLNDDFANALADTLRRFIEVATPAIMNFLDERDEV